MGASMIKALLRLLWGCDHEFETIHVNIKKRYYAADDDIGFPVGFPVYIEITQECAKCGRLHFINEKIDT